MRTPYDFPFRRAVVLGAGLMGRLLALALARNGVQVQVYEAQGADATGAAAHAAAAMLAPLAESVLAPPAVTRMGQYALERWPELLATLALPVFFQRAGTLVLWHRQDAAEASRFHRVLQQTKPQAQAQTQPHPPELPALQTLDAAAVQALEPSLGSRFAQAMYLPGEGQLDNRALLAALLHALHNEPLVQLHWHSPRTPADFAADAQSRTIDCRGLGAQGQWPRLRGVRGEVLRLHAPDVALSRPTRLLHPRYPLYIAPKPGHIFVVGATEIESDDMSPVSVRSALELLSAAYAVHSGFAEARILEIISHCRPSLPDNRPALRQPSPFVLQINGLYRHGFLIAPAMLDAALELLAKQKSALAERFELSTDAP